MEMLDVECASVSDISPVNVGPYPPALEWKTAAETPLERTTDQTTHPKLVIQTTERFDTESRCHTPTPSVAVPFKAEYSPAAAWRSSPSASVTVLRAEVARLEALQSEAERAIDRAHHQIEEQESFALKLQRQLRGAESELEETREHKERLSAQVCDLHEQLRDAQGEVKDNQCHIQDLKHQLMLKDSELIERTNELKRQRQRVEHRDGEVETLKEEYLHLQRNLQRELNNIESAAAEENKRAQTLESLRKENKELKNQVERQAQTSQSLQYRNRELESSYASLEKRLSAQFQRGSHIDQQYLGRTLPGRQDTTREPSQSGGCSSDPKSDYESCQQDARPSTSREAEEPAIVSVQPRERPRSSSHSWWGEETARSAIQDPRRHPERRWNEASETSPLKWAVEEPIPTQSSTHVMMKAPYATQHSLQDVQLLTHQLEHRLMQLSLERNQLQSEYAKMPVHSGRTLAARMRKKEVEAHMDSNTQEMSQIRFKLKYLTTHLTL